MSLFYITGLSGTGKSAILKELQHRGYEAHGVDEDVFAHWVNRRTGKIDIFPASQDNFDIHAWYKDHDWVLDAKKIQRLRERSDTVAKPIFLCGVGAGEDKAWHSFTKVFALVTDVETIKQRIRARTDNNYGKTAAELKQILEWHAGYAETYRGFGAIIVDASQPVSKVVDEIIKRAP